MPSSSSSSSLLTPPLILPAAKTPRIFPLILLLALISSIITKPASACLTYSAVFPFDEDQPFVAEIIDNGVRTCWINMTYTRHWRLQVIENGGWRGSEEWEWKPWRFECTEKEWEGKLKPNVTDRKYHAEAGVGLRGITYYAHGERFWFNPDVVEDVAGERWVYSKRLWCVGEAKGKGKAVGGK